MPIPVLFLVSYLFSFNELGQSFEKCLGLVHNVKTVGDLYTVIGICC